MAQRTGCRISRVGEDLGASGSLLRIETLKIFVSHVDFAAHVDYAGHIAPFQLVGNLRDGHDVARYILPFRTIAAGRGLSEASIEVTERNGQAIDFGLGRKRERRARIETKEAVDAFNKLSHILIVEGIGERKHRNAVAHLAKAFGRRRADALRGAVSPYQIWKPRLDRLIALTQHIVIRVRDFRRVLPVIEVVVMADAADQPFQLRPRLRLAQLVHRDRANVFAAHACVRLPLLPGCLAHLRQQYRKSGRWKTTRWGTGTEMGVTSIAPCPERAALRRTVRPAKAVAAGRAAAWAAVVEPSAAPLAEAQGWAWAPSRAPISRTSTSHC